MSEIQCRILVNGSFITEEEIIIISHYITLLYQRKESTITIQFENYSGFVYYKGFHEGENGEKVLDYKAEIVKDSTNVREFEVSAEEGNLEEFDFSLDVGRINFCNVLRKAINKKGIVKVYNKEMVRDEKVFENNLIH